MGSDPEIDASVKKLSLELRRGVVVLAALSQLHEDCYGYELQQRLVASGLEVEQGTLYPLLRRLAEQGLLQSRWSTDGARPRKYYRLSPAGQRHLQCLRQEWQEMVAVVDALLREHEHGGEHGVD